MNSLKNENLKFNIDSIGLFYDPEELKYKVTKLLKLWDFKIEDRELESYLSLFDILNDFIIEENKKEDKVIYKFSLNDSWLEKLFNLRKFLTFRKILKMKLNEEFKFSKTINSISRYNDKQEDNTLKIILSEEEIIYKLDNSLNKLKWKISSDLNEILKEISSNFKAESIKKERTININKNLLNISGNLNIDTDIDDVLKTVLLPQEFYALYKIKNKENFCYEIEVKKNKDKKNYNDKKEDKNINNSLFNELNKKKKYIIWVLGIAWITGLLNISEPETYKPFDINQSLFIPTKIVDKEKVNENNLILKEISLNLDNFMDSVNKKSLLPIYENSWNSKSENMLHIINTFLDIYIDLVNWNKFNIDLINNYIDDDKLKTSVKVYLDTWVMIKREMPISYYGDNKSIVDNYYIDINNYIESNLEWKDYVYHEKWKIKDLLLEKFPWYKYIQNIDDNIVKYIFIINGDSYFYEIKL